MGSSYLLFNIVHIFKRLDIVHPHPLVLIMSRAGEEKIAEAACAVAVTLPPFASVHLNKKPF